MQGYRHSYNSFSQPTAIEYLKLISDKYISNGSLQLESFAIVSWRQLLFWFIPRTKKENSANIYIRCHTSVTQRIIVSWVLIFSNTNYRIVLLFNNFYHNNFTKRKCTYYYETNVISSYFEIFFISSLNVNFFNIILLITEIPTFFKLSY